MGDHSADGERCGFHAAGGMDNEDGRGLKVKYTFKGRSHGRYVWSSDEGDVCCGVKYFWNPKDKPYKMTLTTREKENAVAAALWDVNLNRDVLAIATDVVERLEKNYTLIRRRKV